MCRQLRPSACEVTQTDTRHRNVSWLLFTPGESLLRPPGLIPHDNNLRKMKGHETNRLNTRTIVTINTRKSFTSINEEENVLSISWFAGTEYIAKEGDTDNSSNSPTGEKIYLY